MSTLGLIEYKDASPEVRAVYDDIMATRKTDWINNFWKAIAHDPVTLKRTWEDIKQIMAPGALDPLTKEMIYVAVSVTNQCNYCIASHTASAKFCAPAPCASELRLIVSASSATASVSPRATRRARPIAYSRSPANSLRSASSARTTRGLP